MDAQLLSERNLKSLRIFCAAAEAGGFAAAEKNLSLSKASISRHIREIEEVLNVKLCERGPSGFKLTLSGVAALKQAQLALDSLARIKPEIDNVRGVLSGSLRIGIIERIYNEQFNLPGILREFIDQAPQVMPNVRVMNFAQMNQALRDRSLDIAIRGMYEEDNAFDYYPLFIEYQKLYAVASAQEGNVPLIYRPHPFIYDLLGTAKYRKGPVASGLEAIVCLIATGKYMGMLPEIYAEEVKAYYPIEEVKDSPFYINNICAIVEKYRPPSAAIDLFIQILQRHVPA